MKKINLLIILTILKNMKPNIIEIGLNIGALNDETIRNISKFDFNNLKIIRLNGNGLHSLDFVKYLECKNLEKFYPQNNNITNYEPLTKFKTLKIINLSKNPINNIEHLNDFINSFVQLEKLFLENTEIDKNNKK